MYQSAVECHWVWIWKRWDLRPFALRRLEGRRQQQQQQHQQHKDRLLLEDFSEIRLTRTRRVYDRWQRSRRRNWGTVSRPGNSSSDPYIYMEHTDAPWDNSDCNRRCRNKVELNGMEATCTKDPGSCHLLSAAQQGVVTSLLTLLTSISSSCNNQLD